MKNIFKILILSFVVTFTNCVSDDGSRFQNDPTSGWVEFNNESSEVISVLTTELAVEIDINVPIYEDGLTVSYSIEPVSGNIASAQLVAPGSVFVNPQNANRITFIDLGFDLSGITEQIVFDVVLTNVTNGVTLGIEDASILRHRVTLPCPYNPSTTGTYSASVVSEDVGVDNTNNAAYQYTATLTPVMGEENTWTIDSAWGPNFVGNLTGNPGFNGLFPYSGTMTLDLLTNEITIVGDDPDLPGGEGTYDLCTDTFSYTLEQDLFNGDFTVDVTLIGQ